MENPITAQELPDTAKTTPQAKNGNHQKFSRTSLHFKEIMMLLSWPVFTFTSCDQTQRIKILQTILEQIQRGTFMNFRSIIFQTSY